MHGRGTAPASGFPLLHCLLCAGCAATPLCLQISCCKASDPMLYIYSIYIYIASDPTLYIYSFSFCVGGTAVSPSPCPTGIRHLIFCLLNLCCTIFVPPPAASCVMVSCTSFDWLCSTPVHLSSLPACLAIHLRTHPHHLSHVWLLSSLLYM